MMDMKWNYKITGRKMPVLLCAGMLAVFLSLTIWLYRAKNGAFLFTGFLTAIFLVLVIATTLRLTFFKVLAGSGGFFYQSNPFDGRFYSYKDVTKAWESKGTAQNGAHQAFCNIQLQDNRVIRFQFDEDDRSAVRYIIRQVNEEKKRRDDPAHSGAQDYLIDGRVFGKAKITIGVALVFFVTLIDIVIVKAGFSLFFLIPGILLAGYILYALVINVLFYKVVIGENEFYCRTNPFNGRTFPYREITECRMIKRVVRIKKIGEAKSPKYYFFFAFTDHNGVQRKFQYENPIHRHEIQILKERIENAQGKSFGEEIEIRS